MRDKAAPLEAKYAQISSPPGICERYRRELA
jgi:hypothetical protein